MDGCSVNIFTGIMAVLEKENGKKIADHKKLNQMIKLCGELDDIHQSLKDVGGLMKYLRAIVVITGIIVMFSAFSIYTYYNDESEGSINTYVISAPIMIPGNNGTMYTEIGFDIIWPNQEQPCDVILHINGFINKTINSTGEVSNETSIPPENIYYRLHNYSSEPWIQVDSVNIVLLEDVPSGIHTGILYLKIVYPQFRAGTAHELDIKFELEKVDTW